MDYNLALWKNWFRHSDPEEGLQRLLSKVPIFNELSRSELRQIREMMHLRQYNPDEVVVREGEIGTGMYVILKGTIRVVLHHGQEDEVEIVRLESGDFFGEFSLLDESPRSATCVAEGNTELGGFFRPDLLDLVDRRPQTGIKIVMSLADVIAERLRHTNAELRLTKEELRANKGKLKKLEHELDGFHSRGVVIERRS